jgi:glycosyltransferase involved in cell wall biosynthesis
MKVAVITGAIDRPAERTLVLGLVHALQGRGHSTVVLCPPGLLAADLRVAGTDLVTIDDLEPLAARAGAVRGAMRRARRVGRHHRAQLVAADHVVLIGPIAASCITTPTSGRVTVVLDALPMGPVRRALTHARGHIDQVAVLDERAALAFGSTAPPVHVLDPDAAAVELAELLTDGPPAAGTGPAVVVAVPDYLPSLGGTTRQARNLALAARDHGRRAIVLTQRLDRHWPAVQRIDGVEVHRLGPASRHRFAMKLFVARCAWWVRRNRDQIAVLDAVMYPDLAVAGRLGGLRATIVCWAGLGDATDTLGGTGVGARRLLARLRRRALRGTTHVPLTPAIADELAQLGIRTQVRIVPTPVDLTRFRPPTADERAARRAELGIPADAVVFVYAGHLRALKRVDRLVDAFARLHADHPHVRLFVVGGARDDLEDRTTDLLQQVHRLQLDHAVTFTGFTEVVEPYLDAADVFVLPSDREGLSNSLLEAMATGLVCIAPPSAGGDQVLDDTTGIVPSSNSVDDLFAAMHSLVDDAPRRAAMGSAAARAARHYSVDAIGDEWELIYRELDDRRR